MAQLEVIVVVPCYNEEHRLQGNLFSEFVSKAKGYRFLFVDDGSKDQTFRALEDLRNQLPEKFEILKLEENSGKAEAVRQGFLKAFQSKPRFLGYWDADLATPIELLPRLAAQFEERPEVEMVFGSRVKIMGHDIKRNEVRHYLGRVFATAASVVLGISVYDTQCGAKLFRNTAVLAEIFQKPFHSRWIFDVEFLARYLKKTGKEKARNSIREFPLPAWHDIRGSKIRPADFFKALWELLRIYLDYR